MSNTKLIADSGSTKTDWVLIQPGVEDVQFQSLGINPFYQTTAEIIPVLEEQVLPHTGTLVNEIHFYGAGCADAKSSQPVRDALLHCLPAASAIHVDSDMLGAARALCGDEPGFACILGTGSNNAFYDGTNITAAIGSLGFWLGDEGSGSYLGKTLVTKYLHKELPEHLQQKFKKDYPEINRLYVLDHAYKKPYPNRFFASFSKFIAANLQDQEMELLVEQAFDLFVMKYVLKHPQAEDYPVHFTGSIAYYFEDILENVLLSNGLQSGNILKSPLEGLVEYHS